MTHLSSLAFTAIPRDAARNPAFIRRQRLIERPKEQKQLRKDPSFTPVTKRWKKAAGGSRTLNLLVVDLFSRV